MAERLPPLNALRCFDVAAKHLSFTKAAGELNVTHSAVSHQIKALEDWLANVHAQVKPLSDSATRAANQASLTLQEAQKRLELRAGEPMQPRNRREPAASRRLPARRLDRRLAMDPRRARAFA